MDGRNPVAPPPLLLPRVGLVRAARDPQQPDDAWAAGFSFEPLCASGGVTDPCLHNAANEKSPSRPGTRITFQAFNVWEGLRCTTLAGMDREWEAQARSKLIAFESYWIEREFWRGDKAVESGWDDATNTANPYLAHPTASDVLTAGPTTFVQALQCLEAGLASTRRNGAIHAPWDIVLRWRENGLVEKVGPGRYETVNENVVIAGTGYDGSGPGGIARVDGSAWAYATSGEVEVRRSQIRVLGGQNVEGVDRSDNTTRVIAERLAAATWDGCSLFAVEINAELCDFAGLGS